MSDHEQPPADDGTFGRPSQPTPPEPAARPEPVAGPENPTAPVPGVPPVDRPQPGPGATAPLNPSDPFGLPVTEPLPTDDPFADTFGRPAPSRPYGGAGWGVPAPVADEPRPRSRAGALVAGALALALVAGAAGGAAGWAMAERDSGSSLTSASTTLGTVPAGSSERPDESIAGIASRLLPTVVSISVRAPGESGSGSGFVIDADGYVLTNNHVVSTAGGQASSIVVQYADGQREEARVVGRDPSYDLAVLKVERDDLAVATLGNSDGAVVGDSVVAVGSPLGLQGTVTTGIVSAKDRPVTTGSGNQVESFISAIQTDAAINPGNSGGPLVDASGAVIGVNSAIASLGSGLGGQAGSIGLGFAIPINQARRVAEEIIRTGRSTHPIIGASVDRTFTGPGARISQQGGAGNEPIAPGGPADEAGLKAGDIVLEVDGRAVNGAEELIVAIRSKAPGDEVTLTLKKGDGEREVRVTLGSDSTS